MAMMAMTFPIVPGKTEAWRRWMDEIRKEHMAAFKAARDEAGVRERTFLQSTPHGDMVIVTLEGNDPAGAFAKMMKRDDAFSKWFLTKVKELHGVDLTAPMPGPLPEMVIDTKA